MAEDFDAFEQYLRQFQPRRPLRPLPSSPAPWRVARVQLVVAAVLLAALGAAIVSLTQPARNEGGPDASSNSGAQAASGDSGVTAGRLTRAALDSSRDVEDVLASATPDALVLVERAGGPLHSLARE